MIVESCTAQVSAYHLHFGAIQRLGDYDRGRGYGFVEGT